MTYTKKAIEHFENPKNVGSMPKDDPAVETGLIGSPVNDEISIMYKEINTKCNDCSCEDKNGTNNKSDRKGS